MFSFFAKKKEEPQVAATGKVVNSAPPAGGKTQAADVVPENFSKSTGFTGKKRVTQRLSVQAVRAFQAANNDLAGGLGDEEQAEASGPDLTVDLPSEVVLRALPDTVLAAPREVLVQQLLPDSKVSLPLAAVLPMLPSGRLEFAVQEIATFLPGHFLQSPESLNGQTFVLPLFEVASRIPQDALRLREDQRPIDSMALRMDDPFNPEQLRAAAEAAAESEAAVSEPEPLPTPVIEPPTPPPVIPVEPPQIKIPEPVLPIKPPTPALAVELPVIPEFKINLPESKPEIKEEELVLPPTAEPEPVASLSAIEPAIEIPPAVEIPGPTNAPADPDFSFAQTEQFRKFLEELETEIATKNNAPVAAEEPVETELPEPVEILPLEAPAEAAVDLKEERTTVVPGTDILVEAKEEPAPLPPDVLTFKAPTPTPPAVIVPPPAPVIPASVAFSVVEEPKPAPVVPEVAPQPEPEPAPVLTLPPAAPAFFGQPAHAVSLSPRVNDILGLPSEHDLSLKDVVSHVRRWPGVKGCAIVDKGGLPIAFDMNDSEFAKTLSAFAPKILSRVHELFSDIGLLGAPEIQVPSDEFSTYICRHGDVYFVLLHDDVNMPVWYSVIVKQILAELSFTPSEA